MFGDFLSALGFVMMLVMAGLTASAFILTVFKWWSEGTIGAVEALGITALFGLLFALLLGPIPDAARPLVGLVIVGFSGALLILPSAAARAGHAQIEEEMESRYRRAIAANPDNLAARTELARSLYRRRRLDEAIEEMEAAILISPKLTESEQHEVKLWRKEREAMPERRMICRFCGEETKKGPVNCEGCGQPITYSGELKQALQEDRAGLIRSMILMGAGFIVLAFVLSFIGSFLANLVMGVAILAGLWWWWLKK